MNKRELRRLSRQQHAEAARTYIAEQTVEAARELWELRKTVDDREAIAIRKFFITMTVAPPMVVPDIRDPIHTADLPRDVSEEALKSLNQTRRLLDAEYESDAN